MTGEVDLVPPFTFLQDEYKEEIMPVQVMDEVFTIRNVLYPADTELPLRLLWSYVRSDVPDGDRFH